jgi:hypothetical protein
VESYNVVDQRQNRFDEEHGKERLPNAVTVRIVVTMYALADLHLPQMAGGSKVGIGLQHLLYQNLTKQNTPQEVTTMRLCKMSWIGSI